VGFRQTGIVVERQARYDEKPRVSMRGLWRLAKTAIFGFSSFPLTVFQLIGYSALTVFVGLSGYALFCKLFTDLAIPGWASHVLSASFFGALNALGISILGEYVIRIYDQVRGRPLYLVARRVNFDEPTSAESPDALDEPSDMVELLDEALALLQSATPTDGAVAPTPRVTSP
jgi:dolichol-phosphate mannosyltransferase